MPPNPTAAPPPRRTGRFQFRLSTLFLAMLAVSVVSAAAAGLVRPDVAATMPREFYLAMLIAAPLGLMIALSVFYAVTHWWGNRFPPKDGNPPESG